MQKRLYVKACARNSAGVKVSGCECLREKAYVRKIVCVNGFVCIGICVSRSLCVKASVCKSVCV